MHTQLHIYIKKGCKYQGVKNQQGKAPVIVSPPVLLCPGHAPGEEAETDALVLRRLDEVEQPSRRLPVRGLVGLSRLLQKVVNL